jgi:hypothetical protein
MAGERTVIITTEEMEAIRTIIEYLQEDEEEDYELREPEDRDNHIWLSVQTLRDWYHGECCD